MAKRLLSCTPREMLALDRDGLLQAIAASEGRTIACETIGAMQPMLLDITNAELAAAQGADLILMNLIDLQNPSVQGLPADVPPEEVIRTVAPPVRPPGGRQPGARAAGLHRGRPHVAHDRGPPRNRGQRPPRGRPGRELHPADRQPGHRRHHPGHRAHACGAQGGRGRPGRAGRRQDARLGHPGPRPASTSSRPTTWAPLSRPAPTSCSFPAPGTVPGITTEYIHARICAGPTARAPWP